MTVIDIIAQRLYEHRQSGTENRIPFAAYRRMQGARHEDELCHLYLEAHMAYEAVKECMQTTNIVQTLIDHFEKSGSMEEALHEVFKHLVTSNKQ